MAQQEIEVILARQLAGYLAFPIFIVDPEGTLLYYNEPAEAILGQKFDETGAMPAAQWTTVFTATGQTGAPLPADELPLMIAVTQRRPAQGRFWIQGLDGVAHEIDVAAFPLLGVAGRFLGAVALFWEAAL